VKRVALYARVSTKQHGQDPETQLMPLRAHANQRGYEIVDEFVDVGWSGAKEKRPALDRLMAAARQHAFDVILVARFDRFARSTKHLLTALAAFEALQIDFSSLNESIDTSTPMGRMVFTIMGAVAEMERALIRERVLAGVDRARRQGKRLGRRPKTLYDKEKVVILSNMGRTVRSISRELGISRRTVDRVIDAARAQMQENSPAQTPISTSI
jgi:DNA invertase Pin-like site-specific DNA recombinase